MHIWWCPSSPDMKVFAIGPGMLFIEVQVSCMYQCNSEQDINYSPCMAVQRGIIELHYNNGIVNIYWAQHAWQNQPLDFGLCCKLVHVKWCHTKEVIESSESSIITEVCTPQYHTEYFFTYSTACRSDNRASSQKYFWILPKHTSSRQDAQIFSGLYLHLFFLN